MITGMVNMVIFILIFWAGIFVLVVGRGVGHIICGKMDRQKESDSLFVLDLDEEDELAN